MNKKTLTNVSVFLLWKEEVIMDAPKEIKEETFKMSEEIENYLNNIDFSKFISKCQQAFKTVKKNIEKLINSNIGTNIALAINTKDVQKQVSQVEKEIHSLQKKIEARYFGSME